MLLDLVYLKTHVCRISIIIINHYYYHYYRCLNVSNQIRPLHDDSGSHLPNNALQSIKR